MRWMLLLLFIPVVTACTNDGNIAAIESQVVVAGLETTIVDFSENKFTDLGDFYGFMLAGPEHLVSSGTHFVDRDNWTYGVTYALYDGDVREFGPIEISGDCAPFVAWNGGFGGAAYWDWNGTPIDVPWTDAVRAVSPDGKNWLEQRADGVHIFGELEAFVPGTFNDYDIGNGIAALVNGTKVHLIGHHAWSWTSPTFVSDIDLHHGYVYVATEDPMRISFLGRAEHKPDSLVPYYTDGGYFSGGSGYFFRGGIDYYGYSVVGPHLYEFNEREWLYVKQTPWEPLEVMLEPAVAWQPLAEADAESAPGLGWLFAIPILAFFNRRRDV